MKARAKARARCLLFLLGCGFGLAGAEASPADKGSAPEPDATGGFAWTSAVPDDCPFERSPTLTGIFFTGRHSDYRCGDTFYPSWASDGNLYSPWTDGKTDGVVSQSGKGANAQTGHAVMIGDDRRGPSHDADEPR